MTVPPPPRDDEPRDDEPRDDEGIDAEFARLMQGVELNEPALDEPGLADRAPGRNADSTADGTPLTVEDVLSAPAADGADSEPVPLALVATSVASSKALAGALRLSAEDSLPGGVRVLDTSHGAIIVGVLDEETAHTLGETVSRVLQRLGVILFFRRGDRMTATRYRQGERGDDVSPVVVLGGVAPEVEQLLLGALDTAELGEGIDPATVTRMQALRWIASGRRRS